MFRRLYEKFKVDRLRQIKAGELLEDALAREFKNGFNVMIPDGKGGKHPLLVIPMRPEKKP